MIFSSTLFLFFYLPAVLLLYLLVGPRFRNTILLLASLVFYAWGENIYVLVMLASITINYAVGLLIERSKPAGRRGKGPLVLGIIANLSLLIFFKYANFIVDNLNVVSGFSGLQTIELDQIHLPIGISFFTFQAISYLVDIYRQQSKAQRNPINLGLYIALFPQLIAGPIVRYNAVSQQISKRVTTLTLFASGAERFIFGLGKKVLLANPLGEMADRIFMLPIDQLSAGTAWLGLICYALQIYFDFSGYSDMAIGLGRFFGFRFLENFNYPYISRSIRDFWQRWHISLSSWYKDYVYIPLGGNRLGEIRTGLNLLLVFTLCGLWHGASWNFLIWGLLHGVFLIAERGSPGKWLRALPGILQISYALFIVLNTWVFFRLDNLTDALNFMEVLYGFGTVDAVHPFVIQGMNSLFIFTFATAILISTPFYPFLKTNMDKFIYSVNSQMTLLTALLSIKAAVLGCILILSLSAIAVGSYNPFIYFRF